MDPQGIIESKISAFVASLIPADRASGQPLQRDTDLLSSGVIDSFNIIEIASYLEQEFSIQIDSDALTLDNFSNIGALSGMVQRLGVSQSKG